MPAMEPNRIQNLITQRKYLNNYDLNSQAWDILLEERFIEQYSYSD